MILIDAKGQVLKDAMGKPVKACMHLPFTPVLLGIAYANWIIALAMLSLLMIVQTGLIRFSDGVSTCILNSPRAPLSDLLLRRGSSLGHRRQVWRSNVGPRGKLESSRCPRLQPHAPGPRTVTWQVTSHSCDLRRCMWRWD